MKEKLKAKKDKLMFAGAIAAILLISILTSQVNLVEELNGVIRTIWNNGQEAVAESEEVKTLSKGGHVEIVNTQVIHLREIYEAMGKDISESQAVAILQENKTLAYHGSKQGISASGKEIDDCIKDIKKQMKDADESSYNRIVKRYGDEDEYWAILRSEVEEYVIAEKMKEDKTEELSKKRDADIDKELQEYIDEIVGYENFKDQ